MNAKTFKKAILAGVMLMIVTATGMILTFPDAEARVQQRISYAHPCDISHNRTRNGTREEFGNLTSRSAQTYLRTGLQNVRDDYNRRVR